jgi:hypothetical protein
MMTSANNDGNPGVAGFPDHGLEHPDENLFSLAIARAKELPATVIESAEDRPILLAGVVAMIAGAAIGVALGGRGRARKPVKAKLAEAVRPVKRVPSGRWIDPSNYAELAELIVRLARNPLIREVLLSLALNQLKKRLP